MRKLFVLSVLLPCLLLVAGCPKKGGDADAAAEGGATDDAAGATAAATPNAKNAKDVARFGTETKIDDDASNPAVFVNARTSPKTGAVVAGLKPGTDVTKFAEYQDCYLVTFADPKDASSTLMGWIEKSSFTYVAPKDAGKDGATDAATDAATVDAGPVDAGVAVVDAGAPKCAAGEEFVKLSASKSACKKKCTADKDCKTPPCAVANANGKAVKVCTAD